MIRFLLALSLVIAPGAALAQGSGAMCAARPGFLGCLPAVVTLARTNVVPVSQVDVARNATIAQILGQLNSTDVTTAGGALLASPTFTGTPAAPTATAGTNTTQIATTAFATTALALKAPLASPSFTGTAAAATAFTAPTFQATTTNAAAVFRGNGTGTTQLGAAAASPVSALYYFALTTGGTLTAAGTTQGTALVLAAQINEITTAAAGTGVLLPNVAVGTVITIFNRGANAVLVYPPAGDNIEASAANVGVSLAVGATGRYIPTTATQWRSG